MITYDVYPYKLGVIQRVDSTWVQSNHFLERRRSR